MSRGLIEIAPQRIIDDDGSAVGERLDRMAHIARNDGDQTRSGDLGCDVTLELFHGSEVLVAERAACHDDFVLLVHERR